MAITQVWVSPGTGGSLDVNTGGTVTETWLDQLCSCLLTLGGTAGFGTVSAANGIQPASGFFLGAVAGNWHAEGGTVVCGTAGLTAVSFVNGFGGTPTVVPGCNQDMAGAVPVAASVSPTGFNIGIRSTSTSNLLAGTLSWQAQGAD